MGDDPKVHSQQATGRDRAFVCQQHLLSMTPPNRWHDQDCLLDGADHQIYQSTLFLVQQT